MLRFTSLLLKNFGPFKGFQEIDFPRDDGVIIIIGENMRGKTSLLNAIRFGLLGTTLNRDGKAHRLIDLINDEAKAEGEYEMRVILEFVFNGSNYRITRTIAAMDANVIPTSDGLLESKLHLQRDEVHLPVATAQRELKRILPPTLARFFLFDGELLQQYEQLVGTSETSSAREEIVEAIEKVLAVPVLVNGRNHLAKLQTIAHKDLSTALARDKKNEKLAEQVNQRRLAVETISRDLSQTKVQLDAYNARGRELEEQLRENEALIEAVRELDRLNIDQARVKTEVTREQERLVDLLPKAWKDLIVNVVSKRASILQEEKDAALTRLGAFQQNREREASLRRALESLVCPTCGQPISTLENRPVMEAELESLRADPDEGLALNIQVADLGRRIDVLRGVKGSGALERALESQANLDGLLVDSQDIERRLARVTSQIEGSDGGQVSSLQDELRRLNEARGVARNSQIELSKALQQSKAELSSLQNKIPEGGITDLVAAANTKLRATTELYELMEDSVAAFRDSLKKEVERQASNMFLALTTEPDYAGLCINENYGLTIRKKGGSLVAIRSAGAEHIVALSLISALQSNSPRPGPVIIDSPFGRLDEQHSNNVVKALPSFSGQVVLLVFERELDLNHARNLLAGSLLAEIRLKRVTASHTAIVEG